MPSPEVLPPLQHRFRVVILSGGNSPRSIPDNERARSRMTVKLYAFTCGTVTGEFCRRCCSTRRCGPSGVPGESLRTIFNVQPIANVEPVPVHRQTFSASSIKDHQGNQLFRELKRAVIIRVVGGQHWHSIGVMKALTRSEAAFEAEYGRFGEYGVASVNGGSSGRREPYTSSVETWRKRKLSLSSSARFVQ